MDMMKRRFISIAFSLLISSGICLFAGNEIIQYDEKERQETLWKGFKRWPAGFGEGKGSPGDWERLKIEYGFESDEEAKQYANNPLDNLEILADNKVPILHMISLKDKVVPARENTLPLVIKYIELGGIATVVPCTKGKQSLTGHHFSIETPRLVADFIKYHSSSCKN